MSHTFHLTCYQCCEVLDVGKIVWASGKKDSMKFGGWRDQKTSDWLEGTELLMLVQAWHIQHQGHILRLLPEAELDLLDPDGTFRYINSAEDVLRNP